MNVRRKSGFEISTKYYTTLCYSFYILWCEDSKKNKTLKTRNSFFDVLKTPILKTIRT